MRAHIKYCPRCAAQDLDFTSYGSEGAVVCLSCRTQFMVLSIRLDLDPPQLASRSLEQYALDLEP